MFTLAGSSSNNSPSKRQRRYLRRSRLDNIEEISDPIIKKEKSQEFSERQIYQCTICEKVSVEREEHAAHVAEHENEPDGHYKCKKCYAKFYTKEEALKHFDTSHSNNDEKSFICQTCTKSFKNRYQLILHIRSHTGEKPFECPVCHRCFSMSSNLQKHLVKILIHCSAQG